MSIRSMAGRLMNIYRRTAFVLDSQSAATDIASPSRQPKVASYIEVTLAGTVVYPATVTVNGLDKDGAAISNTLAFTSGGSLSQTTVGRFASLGSTPNAFVFTGTTGATVSAKAVGADGSRIHQNYAIAENVRCHLNRGGARWAQTVAGTTESERTWIAHNYTTLFSPREGDVYVDQGSNEQWEVIGDPNWLGSLRPDHWEVRVERREGGRNT